MVDITTILGIFSGTALIFMAIFLGGGLETFISIRSLMITVGGTLAATFINYPLPEVLRLVTVTKKAFFNKSLIPSEIISLLVRLAEKARRQGILSLEREMENIEDDFLKNAVQLAVDGTEPELIREILASEVSYLQERHKLGQSIFQSMAAYAPAFGMIGTLIGLIQMLRTLNDPASVGPGMAVALITTFYGALMANLVFLPMAGKLRTRSEQEVFIKELIIEGIISIQSGDNPRIVEDRLKVFLPPKIRQSSFREQGRKSVDEREETEG